MRPGFNEARRIGAEEVYNTKAVDVFDALRTSHPDGVEGVVDLVNGSDVIRRDAEILVRRRSCLNALCSQRRVVR